MLFLLGAIFCTYLLTWLGLRICDKCHLPINTNFRKAVFYSGMAMFVFVLASHNYQDALGWNYPVGVVYLYCLGFVFWIQQDVQHKVEYNNFEGENFSR